MIDSSCGKLKLQPPRQREFPQVGLSLLSAVLYGVVLSETPAPLCSMENPSSHSFSYLGVSTFN